MKENEEGKTEMSGVMLGDTEEVQEVQGKERQAREKTWGEEDSLCDGQMAWVQVNMAMEGWRDWSCE